MAILEGFWLRVQGVSDCCSMIEASKAKPMSG